LALDRLAFLPVLRPITTSLFEWGIILAAFAMLLGAANIVIVHARRILSGERGWGYSLILLIALLTVTIAGMVSVGGVTSPLMNWVFDSILAPGYAALFALLVFFMAGAAFALLRVNRSGGAWLLIGVLLMVFAQAPAIRSALPSGFSQFAVWLVEIPVTGAVRGVLLGVALALFAIGVRSVLRRG
jgi:hypothetical protein